MFEEQLLAERLYVQSIVRFVFVVGIVAGALFARYLVGVENLHAEGLIVLAAVLGVFNSGAFWAARQLRGSALTPANFGLLQSIMHVTITVDLFFITVALWFVGGAKSPFQSFYLIHLMLASVLLSRRAAFIHALSAYTQFSALVLGQWFEIIPVRFPAGAVNSPEPLDGRFVLTVLFVQALMMGLGVYLVTGLSFMLRRGEARLERANEELTRLSAMRQGFLQITLHDLKAPVDATAMLVRNISDGLCGPLTEKQREWLSRCQRRLSEVSTMVHDFEILAMLDAEAIEQQRRCIEIAPLLESIAEEYRDVAESYGHSFTLDIHQNAAVVMGIDRLLHEAVANLLTNAIKYTPEGGAIALRLKKRENNVIIEVEDTGIGIAKEDRRQLFREFVRLSTEAISNRKVKGTGLGLFIVKRIVDIHDGEVELNSTPGVGSVFRIILPKSTRR
ncbi:MAG: sensor histidine kinase [Candidatus Hydrogenedentota bacterium]